MFSLLVRGCLIKYISVFIILICCLYARFAVYMPARLAVYMPDSLFIFLICCLYASQTCCLYARFAVYMSARLAVCMPDLLFIFLICCLYARFAVYMPDFAALLCYIIVHGLALGWFRDLIIF